MRIAATPVRDFRIAQNAAGVHALGLQLIDQGIAAGVSPNPAHEGDPRAQPRAPHRLIRAHAPRRFEDVVAVHGLTGLRQSPDCTV